MRELLVAQFRLSAEARAVERAIENGGQHDALRRLLEVEPLLGRRPEFRYLRYLFDLTFHIRAAGALLPELVNLVAEHPELSEATALLAEVYERSGDPQRAEFFARIALGSESESARARAACVIDRGAQPAPYRMDRETTRASTSIPIRGTTIASRFAEASACALRRPPWT